MEDDNNGRYALTQTKEDKVVADWGSLKVEKFGLCI